MEVAAVAGDAAGAIPLARRVPHLPARPLTSTSERDP
jgi:hypothetical protein